MVTCLSTFCAYCLDSRHSFKESLSYVNAALPDSRSLKGVILMRSSKHVSEQEKPTRMEEEETVEDK